MPKDIKEFKGNCLIIGGGWCESHSRKNEPWRKPEEFYTIDIDEKAAPDLKADITDPSIIDVLGRKFDFIYFERVPVILASASTFKIVYNLLAENGVFFFMAVVENQKKAFLNY